ncbi:hypothetical protein [Desulfocastanea catecholica]
MTDSRDIFEEAEKKGLKITSFKTANQRLYFVRDRMTRLLLDGESLTRTELTEFVNQYSMKEK